jgi:pSer/pThr/pTyr-binding forkhead associated (FHA) protein
MARLILNLDGQTLAEYNMTKERYTVGRLPDNDIRIDNAAVSGHHSLIINILNDSFLEDLNSTNGTYVNGKLIKKHALQHGDVVTVGHHQLRYVDDQADETQDDEFEKTMVITPDDQSAEDLFATERAVDDAVAAALEQADELEPHVAERILESEPLLEPEPALESEPMLEPRPVPAVAALAAAPEPEFRPVDTQDVDPSAAPALPRATLQVLSGTFAGRELELSKALTTLGRPGVQVAAITRRAEGYFIVHVEGDETEDFPRVNGQPIGAQAWRLDDNDIIQLAGVKMGFFLN